MSACKWNGRGEPRVLPGRHSENCPGDECAGCQPCELRHCPVCQRQHSDGACPECITATREDLAAIRLMCGALPAEVEHHGINGEAMMLLGPSADPEAWRNRAMSAMRGRVDAAYLEDCRDEMHPLWVLGTWEQLYRDHFDQPSDLTQTINRAGDYLDRVMHRAAETGSVPFEDFAADVRRCRAHLEDVLRDGVKPERGAPCVQCGRSMERIEDDKTGAQDAYRCTRCHRTVSGDQYRYAVGVAYRAHADYLTLEDCAERTGVNRSTIKVWANREHVRKRKDHDTGRMTYHVGDVEDRHAREPESA